MCSFLNILNAIPPIIINGTYIINFVSPLFITLLACPPSPKINKKIIISMKYENTNRIINPIILSAIFNVSFKCMVTCLAIVSLRENPRGFSAVNRR